MVLNTEVVALVSTETSTILKIISWDFPGCSEVKNLPANAGDTGSIPGPGRSHSPRSNYQARALKPRWATAEACGCQSPCFTAREVTAVRRLQTTTGGQPLLTTTRKKPAQQEDSAQSKTNTIILK